MFKRTALIALAAAVIGYAALPATAEAAGYKSSRSSSFSSSRSSSFSRSSSYSRPKAVAPSRPSTPYSRPSAAPARQQMDARRGSPTTAIRRPTASTPYKGQSATDGYRKPRTPYGGSAYRAPARQVSSPMSGRSSRPSYAPRNTVINNYGSRGNFGGYKGSSGYNRGHNRGYGGYGGGYGGSMMGGQGPGLGSMLLAGAGGAILGNMLYNNFSHTPSGTAPTTTRTDTVLPASEVAQIQQEQRIEDKLDQVNDKLDAFPAGPNGYVLPADAPLMMSPDFYKLGGQM